MKKTLASAVALCILATAGVAAASELKVDGDVNLHYRWNTADGSPDMDGSRVLFRLNATAAMSKDFDFYARYAYEGLGGDKGTGGLADFNQDYYGATSASVVDRFGIIYKNPAGYTVKIGRQGATIGGTALLYSTEGYLGINTGAIDGVSVNAKSGVTTIDVVAGNEWNSGTTINGTDYNKNNGVYGLRASFSPVKDWTVGGTLAQFRPSVGDDRNFYAVDAAYSLGKATFAGEYASSNADAQNRAYDLGVSYKFDNKVSASVTNFRVEKNGNIDAWTDFDSNQKGMYYSANYNFTKTTSFNVFYKSNQIIDGADAGKNNTSFRTTLTYKF